MNVPTLNDRSSGVLLHPTSLPGPHGSGDLGETAYRFVEFLASAGQSWWQMLPVAPVGYGNSPYSALSAFAGSPQLISLSALADEGLLERPSLAPPEPFPADRVDYGRVAPFREGHLRRAFEAFRRRLESDPKTREAFDAFVARAEGWLDDFALYRALKKANGEKAWLTWPEDVRLRDKAALKAARRVLADDVEFIRFEQFVFDKQWHALRSYAASRGVALMGDAPIFVAHDSADVWANPELFYLDEGGAPTVVAGVPPDYFSKTGQLWGNPLYRWKRMKKDGYAWWVARMRLTLERFDAVRLDHFIGFERFWEIPAGSPTAETGRYVDGPKASIFKALRRELGELPLVAEDLGVVTPEVKALRDRFGFPGIRVLQFAFGNDSQAPDFVPHSYPRKAVAYTGTHDNDTVAGWFHDPGGPDATRTAEQAQKEREAAMRYLPSDGREIHWDMIRELLQSVANVVIVPVQDLLGLGSEARMNRPATAEGNWEWRAPGGALTGDLAARLGELTHIYGRWRSR